MLKLSKSKIYVSSILIFLSIGSHSFAAGSSVAVPVNASPQVLNPVNTVPVVVNSNYNAIPHCPAQITNCPDINGVGGDPNTCPNTCTVTRDPEVVTEQWLDPVTKIKDATCPSNYNQVATYNTQAEVKYDSNPPPFPPRDYSAYRFFLELHYPCDGAGSVLTTGAYCDAPFHFGDVTDQASKQPGTVVKIGNPNSGQDAYQWGCHYEGDTDCSQYWDCNPRRNRPTRIYYVRRVLCQPPAGVFLTGRRVPVSIVCSRLRADWESINK